MSDAGDEELVARFLRGDREAFGALVERHERRVYNLAYRMLGSPEDARDAAQDAFVLCLRKLAGFERRSAFSTWLYRITVNVCLDAIRRRGREAPTDRDPDRAVPDPADQAADTVDVHRALQSLPEDRRAVLLLHDVADLPYEEVAEVIGAPLGTIKSRIHRARVDLARALGMEPSTPAPPSNLAETVE